MTPSNSTADAYEKFHKNTLIGASVLSIFGLPGNVLVIVLISRATEKKSTMTYLLLSLAIADIVNLLGIDIVTMWHFLEDEQHATAMLLPLTFPSKAVTNFTLATLALERYDVIVESLKSHVNITRTKIVTGVVIAWIVGMVHCMVTVQVVDARYEIDSAFDVLWSLQLLTYMATLVIVLFCYSSILKVLYFDGMILGKKLTKGAPRMKEMKRLIRILIVITLVFLVCNLIPMAFVLIKSFSTDSGKRVVYLLAAILECVSSALNPYLYGLQSEKYRSQVKELFCRAAKEEEGDEDAMSRNYVVNVWEDYIYEDTKL